MRRTLIRTILTMGWIPTLGLMMGANWMTGTRAFAVGPTPVKVTRLYTGPDGKTKVEEYEIPLKPQGKGTELSQTVPVKSVQFRRTNKDYDLTGILRRTVVRSDAQGESEIELEGWLQRAWGRVTSRWPRTRARAHSRAIARDHLVIPLADGAVPR